MSFLQPVSQCLLSEVSDGVLASADVISGKRRARTAITVCAKGVCYIGDKNVSGTNGIKIANGASLTIPVTSDRYDQLYISGTANLLEYF